MSGFIITGGDTDSRELKFAELYKQYKPGLEPNKDPDFHNLSSDTSIGIEEIRQLKSDLGLQPFLKSPKMAKIQADKLTIEAQNSLLKTLEEPPGETIFFLTSSSPELLLPTIISRCQVIYLPQKSEINLSPEEIITEEQLTEEIIKSSPGKRILIAEENGITKTNEDALNFCRRQLCIFRNKLLKDQNIGSLNTLKNIQISIKHLKSNTNTRLVVENLLLNY